MVVASTYPEFKTITCLEWKPLIASERNKDIVIDSLNFLTREGRIAVFGFVIMNNHFHLIWQIRGNHARNDVQRDFLKYTGQKILKELRDTHSPIVEELRVATSDRRYQVWERNSLGVPLTNEYFLLQKLNYIHNNPVRAGLCRCPEEYKYSSARFYSYNERNWSFLEHYAG